MRLLFLIALLSAAFGAAVLSTSDQPSRHLSLYDCAHSRLQPVVTPVVDRAVHVADAE